MSVDLAGSIDRNETYAFNILDDLDSDIDQDNDDSLSPRSKAFSLRIPRVHLKSSNRQRSTSSSSSSSNDDKARSTSTKIMKKKRTSKKQSNQHDKSVEQISTSNDIDQTKTSIVNDDKHEQEQARIDHLKKLLRTSGIRLMMKKTELDEYSSNEAKIEYLQSLFTAAGYHGEQF
jgi:hypothetical protein